MSSCIEDVWLYPPVEWCCETVNILSTMQEEEEEKEEEEEEEEEEEVDLVNTICGY